MPEASAWAETLTRAPYTGEIAGGDGTYSQARGKQRLRIFIAVFSVCCVIGWGFTFLRPPIYRSTATVMIATPPAASSHDAVADHSQRVTLHSHVLTSQALLQDVRDRMSGEASTPASVSELREMLAVVPINDTNIVELRAEGSEPGYLSLLVDTWIDAYLLARAESQKYAADSEHAKLEEELRGLDEQIHAKREELDRFRRENDIITMGQNETQVLARLKGMSDALNKASEDQVTAEANLNAIRQAMANDKPVVRNQERASLSGLEARAVDLREQLRAMENKYTPSYMELDPEAKALKHKLRLVEDKIRDQLSLSTRTALSEAERELASSRQRVETLRRQLADYKQTAADFNTRFAEHEAGKEELLQLEALQREVKERLVKIQVRNEREFPQVDVIERATLPERPIRPHYLRDAGITLIAALVLGLLAIWLYEFLTRSPQTAAPTLRQLFYAVVDPRGLPRPQVLSHALEEPTNPALEQPLPRELSEVEVRSLLDTPDPSAGALVCVLLSGLDLEEAASLQWQDVLLEDGHVDLQGRSRRGLKLAEHTIAQLEHLRTQQPEHEGAVWSGKDNEPLSTDDLEALITCAAYDAGLTRPTEVTAASIQHTYLAFLARQGVRLSEIRDIAGYVTPATLSRYGVFSPPVAGTPANDNNVVYPVLHS